MTNIADSLRTAVARWFREYSSGEIQRYWVSITSRSNVDGYERYSRCRIHLVQSFNFKLFWFKKYTEFSIKGFEEEDQCDQDDVVETSKLWMLVSGKCMSICCPNFWKNQSYEFQTSLVGRDLTTPYAVAQCYGTGIHIRFSPQGNIGIQCDFWTICILGYLISQWEYLQQPKTNYKQAVVKQ